MIRHGQTEWNALHRYQGHTDIKLNQAGRIQARQVAEYLYQNEQIEAIYSSDLARSLETAQIIAQEIKLPVTSDRRLREIHFGRWEGLTFREVYDQFRQEFDTWFSNTADFRAPGGESFQDLIDRSLQAVQDIAGKHSGTVAVATHGGVIMALLYHLEVKAELWKHGVPPGSLSDFEIGHEGIKVGNIGLEVG
ncbi:MAG: alpha-ribazole phosphatase [Syntrophomonadaceae bacterium]